MLDLEMNQGGFGGECRIYIESDQMGTFKITRVEKSAMGCDPIRTFFEEIPEGVEMVKVLDDIKSHPSALGRELGIKYYTDVSIYSPSGVGV